MSEALATSTTTKPSKEEIRRQRLHILQTGRLTPKEFMELTQGSYRQVQYRDKSGALSPSERRKEKYRSYIFWDVLRQEVANILHEHGYAPQKVYDHPNPKVTKAGKITVAQVGLLTLIVQAIEARDRRPQVLVEECVLYLRCERVPISEWNERRPFFLVRGFIPRLNKKGPDPLEGEWKVFHLKDVADKFIATVTARQAGLKRAAA